METISKCLPRSVRRWNTKSQVGRQPGESACSIITALVYCNAAHASTVFSVDDKIDDGSLPLAASAVPSSVAVADIESSVNEMILR